MQVANVKEEGGGGGNSASSAPASCPFTGTLSLTLMDGTIYNQSDQVKLPITHHPLNHLLVLAAMENL